MVALKILVVDGEPRVRRVMRTSLALHGYEVIDARSVKEALDKFQAELPDLILLDFNIHDMEGLEICRILRANSETPVIVLSNTNSERDVVSALDAGADDFVMKPFRTEELLARIRAVMRRSLAAVETAPLRLSLDGVEVDFEGRRITSKNGSRHLTPKEFELLRYLVARAGKVVSHRRLLQAIWGPDYDGQVDYLRVFINQLRKKVEADPARPKFIVTEPWVGYRFVPPGEPSNTGHVA